MELWVSEKGAVSIYRLNYWPFTLYAGEWKAVFEATQGILRFIAAHHLRLSCRCSDETRRGLRESLRLVDIGHGMRDNSLWCKKASTGAVSLYGLRRFPVTLYCAQWLRVLDGRPEIEAFIEKHKDRLDAKGCCVPKPAEGLGRRPLRETLGADNIIRPTLV